MQHNEFDFDFFVIGAGSGGVRAARTAAGLGARTAIAEQLLFGGTCVNVGCIPKKLYTYAAQFAHHWRDAVSYGWQTGELPAFNWERLKDNKDKEINRLNGIYRNILGTAGVQIIEGRAVLEDIHRVRVGDKVFTARHILISTGGRSQLPEIPGIELAIDSDGFFELTKQPKRVLVVGGGYIATELAGVFAGLGSTVHLVHRGNVLLGDFDAEIASFVTEAIASYTDLNLRSQISRIEKNIKNNESGHELLVTLDNGRQITVDTVLFATGRKPNTGGLGLERIGVQLDEGGGVHINEFYDPSANGHRKEPFASGRATSPDGAGAALSPQV
jgi:glutathione reductase (NADPH)